MKESDYNKIFARNLNYYLQKHNMTQSELANRLGVSATSVSNWIRGLKTPRMDKVDKMCSMFGIQRNHLISDIEPKSDVLQNPDVGKVTLREISLILDYRQLNEEGQEKASEYISDLKDLNKYKKRSENELVGD